MVKDDSLDRLEKRVFDERVKDGLFEMLAGVTLVITGLLVITNQLVLAGIVVGLVVILFRPMRARLIEPRLGIVRPAGKRAERMNEKVIGTRMLIVGIAFLGLVVFYILGCATVPGVIQGFLSTYILEIYFLILFGVLLVFGRIYGYRNLTYYLLAAIIVALLQALIRWPESVAFILLGLPLFIYGLVANLRFVEKYPKLDQDMDSND